MGKMEALRKEPLRWDTVTVTLLTASPNRSQWFSKLELQEIQSSPVPPVSSSVGL